MSEERVRFARELTGRLAPPLRSHVLAPGRCSAASNGRAPARRSRGDSMPVLVFPLPVDRPRAECRETLTVNRASDFERMERRPMQSRSPCRYRGGREGRRSRHRPRPERCYKRTLSGAEADRPGDMLYLLGTLPTVRRIGLLGIR